MGTRGDRGTRGDVGTRGEPPGDDSRTLLFMSDLSNRLTEMRTVHRMSQEEVASELHVSRQAVSKWETGKGAPDTTTLIALADVYGVSLDELVGRTPEEPQGFVSDIEVYQPYEPEPAPETSREIARNSFTVSRVLGMVSAIIPCVYIVLGFAFGSWATAWLLFLLIPIIATIQATLKRNDNPKP